MLKNKDLSQAILGLSETVSRPVRNLTVTTDSCWRRGEECEKLGFLFTFCMSTFFYLGSASVHLLGYS